MTTRALHYDRRKIAYWRELISALGLAACLVMLPAVARALSLEEAKTQGLVGEESTGYLGAVETRADVSALVQSVNNQRKQKYADIAKKNGTTLSAVEALAGKKAVENTSSGQFIRTGGGWSKK